jgi:hypothetical protein
MIESNTPNVFAAFEMLMEEIEAEVDLINKIGTRAMERRDYDEESLFLLCLYGRLGQAKSAQFLQEAQLKS